LHRKEISNPKNAIMKKEFYFRVTVGIISLLLLVKCDKIGDITEQSNPLLLKNNQTDLLPVNIPPERAYICSGNIVEILDLPTLSFVDQIEIPQGGAFNIKIIESKKVACVTHNFGVSKIDLNTNKVIATLDITDCPQTADVAVTPDNKTALVTLYNPNSVAAINVDTWELIKIIPLKDGDYCNGIEMGQGGQYAFTASQNSGRVHVIDVKKLDLYKEFETNTDGINELALTPGGQTIFCTAYNQQKIVVIDSKKVSVIKNIELSNNPYGIDITRDGKTAITIGVGINQIDIKTLTVVKTVQFFGSRIRINSNGKLAIIAGAGMQQISILNLDDLSVYHILDSNGEYPRGIDFLVGK
jgi:DNA-binding beta-propeller fold protein YncE